MCQDKPHYGMDATRAKASRNVILSNVRAPVKFTFKNSNISYYKLSNLL